MSIQLTKLLTVKARVGIEKADLKDDALLQAAINAVSARFQKECNRFFDYAAAAKFSFRANEFDLRVDRPPIASVTTFETKDSEAAGWVAVATGDVPDYLINATNNIIELASPLGSSKQLGRVTYVGGFILPGETAVAGIPALPDDIEQACVEQCAYWYQRKSQLGLVSISGDGGSISQFRSLDLLPSVEAVIQKHTRWIL